jgi:hypothetical protein
MLWNIRRLGKLIKWIMGAGTGGQESARAFLLQQLPRHSTCAEIGVYKGAFSASIIEIVKPTRLHLIDPWRYEGCAEFRESWYGGAQGVNQANMDAIHESVLRRFQIEITSGTVCVHRAGSSEAAVLFPDEYFDWVYIDGNHRYEFVKNDLELYCEKVKRRGYLTGDDYENQGWWQGGVKKAVDEFAAKGSVEVVNIAEGQFALRKK